MRVGGNGTAEQLPQVFLAGLDGRRVFAVGEEDRRHFGEQSLQHSRIVHQHIAGGRAHEHLDPGHAGRIEGGDGIEVVVADPEVKAVVGHRVLCGLALLVGQGFEGQGRRLGVGHVHIAGDTADHRCPRLGVETALGRRAGIAEMHLVVDHPGQQPLTRGVDFLVGAGVVDLRGEGLDPAIDDPDISIEFTPLVHHAGVADQQAAHGQNSFCRAL